jgi:hypothetical protein
MSLGTDESYAESVARILILGFWMGLANTYNVEKYRIVSGHRG